MLIALRLGFSNWGEQNGGEKEQRKRFDSALIAAKRAYHQLRLNITEPTR